MLRHLSGPILTCAGALAVGLILFWRPFRRVQHEREDDIFNPETLKQHSRVTSVKTQHVVYPAIRSVYRPHPHLERLPSLSKLPLLVFVHGLGGSVAQFALLLRSLGNIAPCFGVDLPGCGLSALSPKDPAAFTTEALAELVKTCIESICEEQGHESVVLICHGMGCSLAALLISEGTLSVPVQGLIAICPKASPPTEEACRSYRRLLSMPDFVLDLLRLIDRSGMIDSHSVPPFLAADANTELKKLQLRYNKSFSTAAWKYTVLGFLPTYVEGEARGGYPGRVVWAKVRAPLFLVAGEPHEIATIASYLQSAPMTMDNSDGKTVMADSSSVHAAVVRSAVLPRAASPALLYDHSTYRTVAGLIEDFLDRHISKELSLGWQLQHLTTTGKWDVKNLTKWEKVLPVSGPIGRGLFRALKTLREQDSEHTPSVFVPRWTGKIYAVIDISLETPIYNTSSLDRGGIQYHKFPTVSKMPPTDEEVKGFIALVDRLREEIETKYPNDSHEHSLGLHCHYGYNRTGYFIVCYLVERAGYSVQAALDDFAAQKPPGIKHDHFIDALWMRYCVGLREGINTGGAS